jgi:hypothetical protein
MPSLKDLKSRLQGNKVTENKVLKENKKNTKDTIEENIKDTTLNSIKQNLELEEARYLLSLIAKSDFNGKDIQIVYNVALKLQQIIESILNSEDVKNNG